MFMALGIEREKVEVLMAELGEGCWDDYPLHSVLVESTPPRPFLPKGQDLPRRNEAPEKASLALATATHGGRSS